MANPTSEFQFEIFLSYSAKDKAVVRRLAERLQPAGLRVWFGGDHAVGGLPLTPARQVTFA